LLKSGARTGMGYFVEIVSIVKIAGVFCGIKELSVFGGRGSCG